jgi:hypothetical protein
VCYPITGYRSILCIRSQSLMNSYSDQQVHSGRSCQCPRSASRSQLPVAEKCIQIAVARPPRWSIRSCRSITEMVTQVVPVDGQTVPSAVRPQ